MLKWRLSSMQRRTPLGHFSRQITIYRSTYLSRSRVWYQRTSKLSLRIVMTSTWNKRISSTSSSKSCTRMSWRIMAYLILRKEVSLCQARARSSSTIPTSSSMNWDREWSPWIGSYPETTSLSQRKSFRSVCNRKVVCKRAKSTWSNLHRKPRAK